MAVNAARPRDEEKRQRQTTLLVSPHGMAQGFFLKTPSPMLYPKAKACVRANFSARSLQLWQHVFV